MADLRKIERQTFVAEVLQEVLDESDQYLGVVVVGLRKSGEPILRSSAMNDLERAFICQFHQAVMLSQFYIDDEPEGGDSV